MGRRTGPIAAAAFFLISKCLFVIVCCVLTVPFTPAAIFVPVFGDIFVKNRVVMFVDKLILSLKNTRDMPKSIGNGPTS